MIVGVARAFSKDVLLPRYQSLDDHDSRIPQETLRALGELGLIAPGNKEEHGGIGLDSATVGLVLEALAEGDFNITYIALIGSLTSQILSHHAAPGLAREWVPGIVRGEHMVGLALTEPQGGSDAANIQFSARAIDGGYLLNGEKTSITLAHCADAFVVFGRTGTRGQGASGVSAFLVKGDSEGLSRTRFKDMGGRVIGRGSLFFDDVFVPSEYRIGDEGDAFKTIMHGFDFTRALLGLQCVGAAQASLRETWQYTRERAAFGRPIIENQGVSFPLAEAEGRLEAARQLCLYALQLRDAGLPHSAEAAMCKWIAPEAAVEVIHRCLITHGHYGWSIEFPHQQRLRDVIGMEIGDGGEQIMKIIISKIRGAKVDLNESN
ncbi:acyl-CoA dehydrogenase family protein [Spongiibacter taiwanensis]|uniref:acyl-CoA dehydrogenase family protein n=1 Tax=Spongiibacter taiwanensis TaxID=1748242 RepID=UPI002034EDB3|nr:acyl-CoA dehydrogenase family protein [Spongiibacter taiwanensis]USA41998.1 acyl-CoA dehydrogenase family protein [Spongiibacter taiwanensis]